MSETAPSESDLVAIAAHLHVQLRRKTGRVIDVEWLVANAEYAEAVIAHAKANATTQGAPDLEVLAIRLERALQRYKKPRQPLLASLAIANATQQERQVVPPPGFVHSTPDPADQGVVSEFGDSHRVVDTRSMPRRKPDDEQYVWSLR
jgi:hypothetical protein